MSEKYIDDVSGVETTGHEWDGIRELNNPLPRWWVWTFYATIIWAIGYSFVYPSWPLLRTATTGYLGYTSRAEVKNAMAQAEAAKGEYINSIRSMSVSEIVANPQLREFAIAGGSAAFKVNCVQCHGSGAEGSTGYPNLNDDVWLWGGAPEEIVTTITHGVRFDGDDDTRLSEMSAFAEILEAQQIDEVANYVASLKGFAADAALAEAGKTVFADNCTSCHGEDAKGGREFGAPNLTTAVSLYVKDLDTIRQQIRTPSHGIMPAWGARLGDVTVKQLAVYVHSLGGGE